MFLRQILQTATLKTVAACLPETFVITYRTERNNGLEGTRDFERECTCSNLLLLSFLVSEKHINKRYNEPTDSSSPNDTLLYTALPAACNYNAAADTGDGGAKLAM